MSGGAAWRPVLLLLGLLALIGAILFLASCSTAPRVRPLALRSIAAQGEGDLDPVPTSVCPWPTSPPADPAASFIVFEKLLRLAAIEGWPGCGDAVGDLVIGTRPPPSNP
ncbi:MAG TPA: hypothetical protein VKF62_14565 [Planctomycetota bacterium]|nr:hypothetical protein [Planctomycetota bacterium]